MIVAREFRVPPSSVLAWSYVDFYSALQLLAEERVGKAVRAQQQSEDAQFQRAQAALKG